MIDTDKYEGHTPAPWKAHNDFYKNGIDENNLGEVESFRLSWGVTLSEERLDDYRENRIGHHVMHIADAKLIADAPDLLAKVERLRMYEVAWKILYDHGREEERETRTRTWKEIMELVRSDVREMVDESHTWDEWLNSSIGGFE